MVGIGKGEASFTVENPGLDRSRREVEARCHTVRPEKPICVVPHLVAAEHIEIARAVW